MKQELQLLHTCYGLSYVKIHMWEGLGGRASKY